MRKSILSLLLVMILLVGLLPTAVYAQVIDHEGYSFNTETGELHIKNDAGSTQWRDDPSIAKEDVKSVTFQRLYTPVLNLGESAFEGCVNLEGTIKLNADATSIGANAFKGCDKVDLILIPEGAQADIETAGIPEQTAYVVYQYDNNKDWNNFFVKDVHYGSEKQVVFDGTIFDGTWSCGVIMVCEDKFNVVPAPGETAWYYHTEADGQITVTKYVTNPNYRQTITLSKNFGDLVVKQYADDAFSYSGLTAQNIIVVDEGIQATIPEEVSKMVIKTENRSKVAYLTEGTSGSIDQSLHQLIVPQGVSTLFMKDITINSAHDIMMMEGAVVSYTEDAGGKIVITNVLLGDDMWDQEYIVPTTVENKPVTTVMINSKYNHDMNQIIVDESVNKIIYESDPYSGSGSCTITQIVQGSNQASVEIPSEIAGNPVESIPTTAFDESVDTIIVSEGLNVAQPEDVCKIVYTTDSDGKIIITDIIPGKDENGEMKPVTVPDLIMGKTPTCSEEVKDEMKHIPHEHSGGTATCTEQAECFICGQKYGDLVAHDLDRINEKEATCTEEGYTGDEVCVVCGTVFEKGEVIPKLAHNYRDGRCIVCGAIDSSFRPVITSGANAIWQKGGKDGISFISNAAFDDFIKVQVDGKDLDVSAYTVKEGSTIVTLKDSYLDTLSVGKHTLSIVSKTGIATTDFTVEAKNTETNNPQSGDNSNVILWVVLIFVSAGTVGTMIFKRGKPLN